MSEVTEARDRCACLDCGCSNEAGLAECAYWYFLMTQQGGPDGSELDAAVTEDMLYALRDWAATNPDPDYLAALATDEAVP